MVPAVVQFGFGRKTETNSTETICQQRTKRDNDSRTLFFDERTRMVLVNKRLSKLLLKLKEVGGSP